MNLENTIEWRIDKFEELNIYLLYNILNLRSNVFVSGQKIIYTDPDFKDQKVYHVQGYIGERLVAYCRIFMPGDYLSSASFGRVAVLAEFRGKGYGHILIRKTLQYIYQKTGKTEITISAQSYLIEFYKSHGFQTQGEEYLEEGIPHILMKKIE